MPVSFTTAVCECMTEFTGFLCEFKNPCANSNVCMNGATCAVTSIFGIEPEFKCVCRTNFTGSSCEINMNTQCTPYTCFERGNCSNDPITNNTICACQPLFTGYF